MDWPCLPVGRVTVRVVDARRPFARAAGGVPPLPGTVGRFRPLLLCSFTGPVLGRGPDPRPAGGARSGLVSPRSRARGCWPRTSDWHASSRPRTQGVLDASPPEVWPPLLGDASAVRLSVGASGWVAGDPAGCCAPERTKLDTGATFGATERRTLWAGGRGELGVLPRPHGPQGAGHATVRAPRGGPGAGATSRLLSETPFGRQRARGRPEPSRGRPRTRRGGTGWMWDRPSRRGTHSLWTMGAMCVQLVDVQCILQFTLRHAVCCGLHRPTSRVIHR